MEKSDQAPSYLVLVLNLNMIYWITALQQYSMLVYWLRMLLLIYLSETEKDWRLTLWFDYFHKPKS
jgi:hypothetical protein